MLPMSPILYSVTRGTSGDMLSVTVGDRGVALVKRLRYLSANVSDTGSSSSMIVLSSCSDIKRSEGMKVKSKEKGRAKEGQGNFEG
jgi:hypothetical protein